MPSGGAEPHPEIFPKILGREGGIMCVCCHPPTPEINYSKQCLTSPEGAGKGGPHWKTPRAAPLLPSGGVQQLFTPHKNYIGAEMKKEKYPLPPKIKFYL